MATVQDRMESGGSLQQTAFPAEPEHRGFATRCPPVTVNLGLAQTGPKVACQSAPTRPRRSMVDSKTTNRWLTPRRCGECPAVKETR